jgi:alpha-beta hydrolase superfamily lysophospholipase
MSWKIVALLMITIAHTARSESWSGLYRQSNGGIIGIGELHEFGPSEVLVDYRTCETGPLFALPGGRMGVGRAIGDRSPLPAHILERKKGRVLLDGRPLIALEVSRQSFQVENGSVKLAGELVRPGKQSKGVIVFVHGSGDGPRRAYDIWTNFFLSRGWAVVVFDKRGSGSSTGDWHDADFVTLAGDVRRTVKWSRQQPQLAGLKIGLWGASQAGWIIPQLAAGGEVDFAIVQAGAIVPTDEFISQTLESELRAYGFPPDEIAKAQRYYRLDVAVSRSTQPFAAIEKAYADASAAGAEWLLKAPDPINSPDRRFMAKIAGFDAAAFWQNVRIPLLVLFGGKDHVVPVGPNRSRLERLLSEAGKAQTQIVTLEDDNHLAMLAKTGVRTEYATLNHFDPAYFQTLTGFLDRMLELRPANRRDGSRLLPTSSYH